jgi:hypothetical protein
MTILLPEKEKVQNLLLSAGGGNLGSTEADTLNATYTPIRRLFISYHHGQWNPQLYGFGYGTCVNAFIAVPAFFRIGHDRHKPFL